jgi:hypothetical protein
MKLLFALVAVAVVMLFAAFGTLSPCGMLREVERKQDGLTAILPDVVVDAALVAKYGSLTPGKCVGLLVNGRAGPTSVPVAATPQQQIQRLSVQPPTITPSDFVTGLQRANAAIGDCRERRIRGELKSHVESVQCSNPRVARIFNAAKYRYMDLVELLNAKRLEMARRLDQGQITEDQAAADSLKIITQTAEIERSRDIRRN